MNIFGKSAQDLNPLIKIGSKGFAEYADEAKRAGAVLDGETLTALQETDDAMERFNQGCRNC